MIASLYQWIFLSLSIFFSSIIALFNGSLSFIHAIFFSRQKRQSSRLEGDVYFGRFVQADGGVVHMDAFSTPYYFQLFCFEYVEEHRLFHAAHLALQIFGKLV